MENELNTQTTSTDTDLNTQNSSIIEPINNAAPPDPKPIEPPKSDNAEIARLKASIDKLTKENAEQKRVIRAKQTAEEAEAEAAKERQEAIEKELNELRKKSAVSEISKRVMSFVGDENTSNAAAEYLYGAADIDAALDVLQKAWVAKEKKLRMEFGKIPAPGAGSDEISMTKEQFAALSYTERMELLNKHPESYKRMTT